MEYTTGNVSKMSRITTTPVRFSPDVYHVCNSSVDGICSCSLRAAHMDSQLWGGSHHQQTADGSGSDSHRGQDPGHSHIHSLVDHDLRTMAHLG